MKGFPRPVTTLNTFTADLQLVSPIRSHGYVFVPSRTSARYLSRAQDAEFRAFAQSWQRLEIDPYLAQLGRLRRRRHGLFCASDLGEVETLAHGPHIQSTDYNPLFGDVERWFEPLQPQTMRNACLLKVIGFGGELFAAVDQQACRWNVEVHQFRIEARADRTGQPTPEGRHRDGVDFVLVMMVARRNIRSGQTQLSDARGEPLGSFTLAEPMDMVLLDDRRLWHAVTPVEPIQPQEPAFRDVLVVTYKRQSD